MCFSWPHTGGALGMSGEAERWREEAEGEGCLLPCSAADGCRAPGVKGRAARP